MHTSGRDAGGTPPSEGTENVAQITGLSGPTMVTETTPRKVVEIIDLTSASSPKIVTVIDLSVDNGGTVEVAEQDAMEVTAINPAAIFEDKIGCVPWFHYFGNGPNLRLQS